MTSLPARPAVERAPAGRVAGHGSDRSWVALVLTVSCLAFVARLVPLLRGGGLFGLGNYDDGVHFASALGLVHGRLPYHDFLLLQPPGIVLALAPFAALSGLIGDPAAFAVGRLAWMVLGATSTVLIARILRPTGRSAAWFGGLAYALFYPAIYTDHTTELETLGTVLTLAALVVLSDQLRARPWWLVSLGGALLGVAAGVKIWGALVVVVVVAFVAISAGARRGLQVLAGAAVGTAVVCLPFFVRAPGAMARMVVHDQLGRPSSAAGLGTRLATIVGQGTRSTAAFHPVVLGLGLVLVVVAAGAVLVPRARLAFVVLLASFGLLLATPSWFLHYASLVSGPAAVAVGAGLGYLVDRARARGPVVGRAVTGAGLVVLALYGVPAVRSTPGVVFPSRALSAAVRPSVGCVTADDPTTLIEMNVVSRNLDRGCPLVVDLGGWTYDNPPARRVSRADYAGFQRHALAYLSSGGASLSSRFRARSGFSPMTARTLSRWPVVARAGRYVLRRPT